MLLQPTQAWYSWSGLNQDLFIKIYGQHTGLIKPYFDILEFVGEREHIGYYALMIALLCGLNLLWRALSKNKIDGYFIRSQVAWILSFIVGFVVVVGSVGLIKEYTAFPRPYSVIEGVKLLYPTIVNDNTSFPSGHAAFTAFLLVILWSRMPSLFNIASCAVFLLMCWYRVVIGAHFPADVIYGAIIGLFFTNLVRAIMCKIFKVWQ